MLSPRLPSYRNATLPVADRVSDLLARMTLEEKFWQLFMIPDDTAAAMTRLSHGIFGLQVRAGTARAAAERVNALQHYFVEQTRLGIPMLPFEEALHGLTQGGATMFPQSIALAASWDTSLMSRMATTIAGEARGRGIRMALSPVINLANDVRWGRVEETYGEDPYLSSRMGVAFVRAFEQNGIVATPKHFIANVGDGGRDSWPIWFNERLLRELYLPPFEAAIKEGGARSVMAAYNSVDGAPATASPWLLDTLLKQQWGFKGFVIADAGSVGGANVLHMTSATGAASAARALPAGLDVIFQTASEHSRIFYPAFERGDIPAAVVDSAVARVLRVKFELGLFEHPYVDVDSAADSNGTAAHRALALEAARAGLTLLRNERKTLPLGKSAGRVAVIGVDAEEARLGGYSGPGIAPVSILSGIRSKLGASRVTYSPGPGRGSPDMVPVPASALGDGLKAEYFDNIALAGTPTLTRTDKQVDFHWTFASPGRPLTTDWYSVRWTGSLVAPVTGTVQLGVEGDEGVRLYVGDRLLIDDWKKASYRTTTIPVAIVAGKSYPIRLEYYQSTGNGRVRLVWNHGVATDWRAKVASAVAAARLSSAAVIVAGVEEGEFRDRSSLRLPGHQEELIRAVTATGKPTVVVVVGGSAITMGSWIDQTGAVLLAWYPGEQGGNAVADALFGDANPAGKLPITFPMAEGQLPLSYYHAPTGRGDDYLDLSGRPAFPFGFGLSYTTFEYSDLVLTPSEMAADQTAEVSFTVRNSGTVAGDEVAQLYIRDEIASLARPVMQLSGFARVHLAPRESRRVTMRLGPERLRMLDAAMHWTVEPGTFRVMVGGSSADIRLRGILRVR